MSSTIAEPDADPPSLQLYSGQPQHEAFAAMGALFPTSTLHPSSSPHRFDPGDQIALPEAFSFGSSMLSTTEFLDATDTAALLVLHHGRTRFEQYWLTGGPDVAWISWSMAKSFISALIGIAVAEGAIRTIEDPVSDYVPELAGSAYDGVSIRAVLEMSSGARWNEDYSDQSSDINRFGAALAGGSSLLEFVAGMQSERPPRTLCQYNSADTQVLGHVLIAATGQPVTDYMQDRLYEPLGMESSGAWLLDRDGVEMAFGGLTMTARDYAKLGELFRHKGEWNGTQLVPRDWVAASTISNEEHLAVGKVIVGGTSSRSATDSSGGSPMEIAASSRRSVSTTSSPTSIPRRTPRSSSSRRTAGTGYPPKRSTTAKRPPSSSSEHSSPSSTETSDRQRRPPHNGART
ncbi:MAG: serine hydrolase domain-containing protein [Actinomycetota bacterium]